jgi:hypothetical protein
MPQLRSLGLSDSAKNVEIFVDEIISVYDSHIEVSSTPVGVISLLLPLIPLLSGRKTKRRALGASRV